MEGKICVPIHHGLKTSYVFARKTSDIKQVEALYTAKCNKLPTVLARGGQSKAPKDKPNSAQVDEETIVGEMIPIDPVLSPAE